MLYRVRAWGCNKESKLLMKRYYRVAEEGDIRDIGECSCDSFYDFLLHLLLDHLYTVEVLPYHEEYLQESDVISVL